MAAWLTQNGIASESELSEMEEEVAREIRAATAAARAAPEPAAGELTSHVHG